MLPFILHCRFLLQNAYVHILAGKNIRSRNPQSVVDVLTINLSFKNIVSMFSEIYSGFVLSICIIAFQKILSGKRIYIYLSLM